MSAECQIGIDFADDKIRLVRIRREGTEAIEAASELRLPGYLNNDGIIDDERGVINALRKLSGTYGAKAGQSVFSVPNDKSNFTWLRFGELEGREMRDAARFKVRRSDQEPQDVAVAIAELETDDKLVVGAPTALVKQRKEVLNRAGYDVVGAETQAQSVLRSVARAHNIDSNLLSTTTVTIAHLTEGRTHIIVLQGGRLNFVRTTRIGYSGILAKAAEALALTIDQVGPVVFSQTCKINEKYVADVSLGDHEYAVDVSEPMDAFAKEFRRVQSYFRSLHPDRSYAGILDRIIVVGAPAQLSGFTQALSKTLAIRVEPHLPTYGLEIDSDDVSFMRLASRPAGFTVALGLAASHYGRPAPVQQEEESSEFVWSRIGF